MLGYRTFVNVATNHSSVLGLVDEQVYSWIREKQWDPDALTDGATVELGPGVNGTLVRLTGQDGSKSMRVHTDEASGWRVTLTAHVPSAAGRSPWLWVDVENDHGQQPGPPRFVRSLLGVLDVRDGRQPLPDGILTAGVDDVASVVDRVMDPQRRTVAFVAGTGEGIPTSSWASYVKRMTRHCSGSASTTVLDATATRAFAEAVGSDLAVRPWTLRTFMPQVDREDPSDPLRHRYLTMQRIINEPEARIAAMLRARATAVTRELPLPPHALRVDRAISKRLDELVVDHLTTVTPEVSVAVGPSVNETSTGEPTERPATTVSVTSTSVALHLDVLHHAARAWLGSSELDASSIQRIVDLAAIGRQAEKQQVAVRSRLGQLQDEVEQLTGLLTQTRAELADEVIEHTETDLERARAEDLARRLRDRLAEQSQSAWEVQPATDDQVAPVDFAEFVARVDQLHYVVFTGDEDVAVGLDVHDGAQRWVVRAWDAVCALEDYASASEDGRCTKGVEGFLRDPPQGCRGYSVNRYGRDETADVHNNEKFRRPRVLPVPHDVDPSGNVFMGAHFKLGQSGMISPRLHYHDDTAKTGVIYVGYVGPHLPCKRTN